jgi:hypothetical protein
MRAWKAAVAIVGGLIVFEYLLVYNTSQQFNEFVQSQVDHIGRDQLKMALVNGATEYSIYVKESDISITTEDAVLRVGVNYRVPVNLLVYRPSFKFHTKGSALVQR